MRRSRRLLSALVLLPTLAACDNEQANELTQSGAWHVVRVTAATCRSSQLPTTVTVADAGDFAFEDHVTSFNRVVFYADKTVPSRALGHFYEPRPLRWPRAATTGSGRPTQGRPAGCCCAATKPWPPLSPTTSTAPTARRSSTWSATTRATSATARTGN